MSGREHGSSREARTPPEHGSTDGSTYPVLPEHRISVQWKHWDSETAVRAAIALTDEFDREVKRGDMSLARRAQALGWCELLRGMYPTLRTQEE